MQVIYRWYDKGGLHTRIHIFRAHTNDPTVHAPLTGQDTKSVFNDHPHSGQRVVEDPAPWREVASWKRPHAVLAEGEGFICHKHMGLWSQLLHSWKQDIFRELESVIHQWLTKGGVCQGPSITSPPITTDIYHTEAVFCIHNCQEDSREFMGPKQFGKFQRWEKSAEMALQSSAVEIDMYSSTRRFHIALATSATMLHTVECPTR